jgi:acetoin utilization deacetylase AcuC-like enzyme
MIVVYTDAHQAHQPAHEIYDGVKEPIPEVAERAEAVIQAIREQNIGEIISPKPFSLDHLLAIHQPEYVEFIKQRCESLGSNDLLHPSYFINDTYSPLVAGTYEAAIQAVNAALTGASLVQNGTAQVYALCRPPGHHAAHKTMGGYCYFNNAAIAANYLAQHGKVSVLDIDFHHGNGTQDAFYERSDVQFVSIHADPQYRYPYASGFAREQGKGEGKGLTVNHPLALGTTDDQYLKTLAEALEQIQTFQPQYVVVSCGFDTFENDPIGGFALTAEVYKEIGSRIGHLNLPTLVVQEGGYSLENLGLMAANFLNGLNS